MLIVVGGLWVLGVAQFSRALDPTGSEKNAVDLSLANARLDGSGNWLTAGSLQGLRATRRGIAITNPPGGAVLFSRRVAVFPHDCYSLVVTGTSTGLQVQVLADNGVTALSPTVRLKPTAATRVAFSPRGAHAVIIAFSNTGHARAFLTDATVRRVAC